MRALSLFLKGRLLLKEGQPGKAREVFAAAESVVGERTEFLRDDIRFFMAEAYAAENNVPAALRVLESISVNLGNRGPYDFVKLAAHLRDELSRQPGQAPAEP